MRKALAELLGVLPEEVRLPAKLGLLDLLAFLRLKGDEALGQIRSIDAGHYFQAVTGATGLKSQRSLNFQRKTDRRPNESKA